MHFLSCKPKLLIGFNTKTKFLNIAGKWVSKSMTCSPRFVKICDIINVSNCETEAFSGHNGIGTCDPSVISVQCSYQLRYEDTTRRAGHFTGFINVTLSKSVAVINGRFTKNVWLIYGSWMTRLFFIQTENFLFH